MSAQLPVHPAGVREAQRPKEGAHPFDRETSQELARIAAGVQLCQSREGSYIGGHLASDCPV